MSVHIVYTVITNLFGLNFFEQKVSLAFVLFLHLLGNFFILFHLCFASYINNMKLKGIYVFADFVQLGIPFLIKNFIMYQAIRMRAFDFEFNEKVKKVYETSIVKKNEKNFLIYLSASLFMTVIKSGLSPTFSSIMYNSCQIASATIDAASDFIFVFQMKCLSDHLKFVTCKNWNNKEEIYKIIEIKNLIHKRFSTILVLSISSYFLLMIIALFWIFIRIAFKFLKNLYGKIQKHSNFFLMTSRVGRLHFFFLLHSTLLLSILNISRLQKCHE